jgi:predicted aconitase with swiveling domain
MTIALGSRRRAGGSRAGSGEALLRAAAVLVALVGCGGGGAGGGGEDAGSSPAGDCGCDGPGGDSAVEISDGTTYDFGDVGVGKTASHTFEIRNRADTDANNLTLSFTGVAFAFAGGSPAMSTTCGGFLAAHATCAVTLAFAPDGPGARSGSLEVGFASGGAAGTVSRALTGRGTSSAAVVIADAPQFSFGSVAPGAVVEHEFTIANRGNADANSTSVVLGGTAFHFEGGSYPGSGGTCAGFLAAGASCTVVVTFSSQTPGLTTGSLRLDFVDAATGVSRSAELALAGSTTTGAVLVIAGGPGFDFGRRPVGHPVDQSFTITNTGPVAASRIIGFAGGVDSQATYTFQGGQYPGTGTCTDTLAAGASCTVILTFMPYHPGATAGRLVLQYDDQQRNDIALTATITTGVQLEIAEAPTFDYGTQLISATVSHVFTVRNTGVNDATRLTKAVAGTAFPIDLPASTCSTSLAAGSACTVQIAFFLSATGSATGTFTISDPDLDSAQLALVGRASPLSFSDGASFNFNTHLVNSRTDQKLFVKNNATSPIVGLHASLTGAAYSFSGGSYPGATGSCGFTLGVFEQCSIVVQFSPPAPGQQDGGLTITDSSEIGPTLQLTGQGQSRIAPPPAGLTSPPRPR